MTVATQGILRQPVHKESNTMIAHSLSNPLLSNFVSHHFMETLPYNTVNTNIEHEAGERPLLHNASIGFKGLTIIAPSMTHHFCIVPEPFLQPKQSWTHPIASQDFEAPLLIQGIIGFLQVHKGFCSAH
jgi:hypothetical protein